MRTVRLPSKSVQCLVATLVALSALVVAPRSNATTINVTCTGSAANCNENLNQIMENANDGDLILVGPGTYFVKATTFVPLRKTCDWVPESDAGG